MSVEDLKKLYSKIEQQSENGDDESQNEQAEVESSALPTILADLDEEDDNTDELEENLWTPNPNIEVEKFLIEHRKKMKIRSVINDKVSNRKTMPDSEEALHQ